MATATPPPQTTVAPFNRADMHRKVTDPLQRLRGYIRTYVTLEGVAVVALFLALWFWIGLALDWGFFKLFGVDWVQVLPWGMRAGVLGLLIAGLLAVVALKVGYRLMREFRDPALALILERRFPKLLGDRLITAVELADPRIATHCGYSQSMIDQTIREAAHQVDKVPINDAFNWRRLKRYALLVVLLSIGAYLLSGATYFASAAVSNALAERNRDPESEAPAEPAQHASVGDFMIRFNNVTIVWFERNIMLRNVIWPRKALLEIMLPESDDKCVGKHSDATIRVRALKWVIADLNSPEGWRALKWSDMTQKLLGAPVAELPREWKSPDDITADQVELKFKKDVGNMDSRAKEALDKTFEVLEQQGTSPSNARKLRKLEVPGEVLVTFRTESGSADGSMTLKRENDNEYAGIFTDLKETIRYKACAEDYCTQARTLRVEPPPALSELYREQSEPAYTLHAPPTDRKRGDELKGRKQLRTGERVPINGDKSTITLKRGSDLVLKGKVDKPLKSIKLVSMGAEKKPEVPVDPAAPPAPVPAPEAAPAVLPEVTFEVQEKDKQRFTLFTVRFDDIQRPINFAFQFTDENDIVGRRAITIDPTPDTAPKLTVKLDPAIAHRKGPNGYMITPDALVPFTGNVQDDYGLSKVDYHYSYAKQELSGGMKARLEAAAVFFSIPPGGPGTAAYLSLPLPLIANRPRAGDVDDKTVTGTLMLPGFQKKLDEQDQLVAVGVASLLERLKRPDAPLQRLLVKYDLEPTIINPKEIFPGDAFDVQKLKLAASSRDLAQYRVELTLSATDNNVEADMARRVTVNDEQFNFQVVAENELLVHMFREKGELQVIMDKKVKASLVNAQIDFAQGLKYLAAPDFDAKLGFDNEEVRANKIKEMIKAARDLTEGVHKDAARLQREMELNRFKGDSVKDGVLLCALLEQAKENEFVHAEAAMADFQASLAKRENNKEKGDRARDRLNDLILVINKILDAFGRIAEYEELKVELIKTIQSQREIQAYLERWRDLLENTPKKK